MLGAHQICEACAGYSAALLLQQFKGCGSQVRAVRADEALKCSRSSALKAFILKGIAVFAGLLFNQSTWN
jgi:hypothetical protein